MGLSTDMDGVILQEHEIGYQDLKKEGGLKEISPPHIPKSLDISRKVCYPNLCCSVGAYAYVKKNTKVQLLTQKLIWYSTLLM